MGGAKISGREISGNQRLEVVVTAEVGVDKLNRCTVQCGSGTGTVPVAMEVELFAPSRIST